jgi:hypothetical protein
MVFTAEFKAFPGVLSMGALLCFVATCMIMAGGGIDVAIATSALGRRCPSCPRSEAGSVRP